MHNVQCHYITLSLFVKAAGLHEGTILPPYVKCLTSPGSLCYNSASVKTPRIGQRS